MKVVLKTGVLEPENFFIDEMSGAEGAVFKEITAVQFGGPNQHRIARQSKMVEEGQTYQIHLVQFADAILYVHPDWLHGAWRSQASHASSRPLMMILEGAHSTEEAARCLNKT
ncbi:hypothetical protein [Roseovarius indicus]|uniref:Uncharacterized protein n=1 Tax=Roseovarius indicus TaxID=540747 RepID=A0A0T5P765_9RHOB|nr:hypothetical protein [Roseovarius indicus]KRS16922.1 hypothetical protein XM52_15160 [Roseovarius indicus]QEW29564.1 hypothetical protein RIdsm_05409 [Roseovarius indicus]SFE47524.1 hypothetical protein SAMN04488031_110173 [Roseovarius indicus]